MAKSRNQELLSLVQNSGFGLAKIRVYSAPDGSRNDVELLDKDLKTYREIEEFLFNVPVQGESEIFSCQELLDAKHIKFNHMETITSHALKVLKSIDDREQFEKSLKFNKDYNLNSR